MDGRYEVPLKEVVAEAAIHCFARCVAYRIDTGPILSVTQGSGQVIGKDGLRMQICKGINEGSVRYMQGVRIAAMEEKTSRVPRLLSAYTAPS